MTEQSPLQVLQRRSELYGPSICLARQVEREKQTEDHIKQNFKKGVERIHSSHTFQTTTARAHGLKVGPHSERTESQHVSHLGFDSGEDNPKSASSFSSPQSADPMKIVVPEVRNYHHLESNRALPLPLIPGPSSSETKNKYTQHLSSQEYSKNHKDSIGNRTARIRDSKGSHFTLGSDPPKNESENMASFGVKHPLDGSVYTAGKPSLPIKGYSIIAHDFGDGACGRGQEETGDLQHTLQQRNYLKNINPRDTINMNLRKAFLEYDKDLSGAISKDELQAVCKNTGLDVSEKEVDEIIRRCDMNGDGLIDYHEFVLNLSKIRPPCSSTLQRNTLASITSSDFKNPIEQRPTRNQILASEKDSKRFEPLPIMPSQLFGTSEEDYHMESITGKDFKKPEDNY